MTTVARLVPRQGRDRDDHARAVMATLATSVYGLTIDECINQIYTSYYASPAPTGGDLEYEREEFHRSYIIINRRFESRATGWMWIRTRHRPPNQWIYYCAAQIAVGPTGQVIRVLDEAISVEAYERYYRDWETRTRTLTRMQVLDIDARRMGALFRGEAAAAAAIERELDELKVISPRLGMLYFGAGLADQNLEIIENDSRAWLVRKELKQVRKDLKQLQRSTGRFGATVEGLMRIRGVI